MNSSMFARNGGRDGKNSTRPTCSVKGEGPQESEKKSEPEKIPVRRAVWGLFDHKPRWSLSWRGKLLFIFAVIVIGTVTFFTIQPFLSVTNRETTSVLVVEGWIHGSAMGDAANEFKTGGYDKVYTTGGPVGGLGGYVSDYSTAASVGAGLLRQAGVPGELVQMVPSRVSGRDRTYASAVALKNWFETNHIAPKAINVLTEGAHARRTRLLFQEAFGKDVKVGIISVPNRDYDPKHWWHYSEGVREVLGESIAYVYARFLFSPSKA